MKKIFVAVLVLLISVFMIVPQVTAFADYNYFNLSYSINPTSIPAGGGMVDLTVKISHELNSAYVMSDTEVLLGEQRIINFRNIYAGQTVTKTGTLQVASSQVGSELELILKWKEDGTTERRMPFAVKFEASGAEPEVEFKRTAVPLSGEPNTEAVVTYTVKNTGTLHITNVEITDPLSGAVDYKDLIKTGESFVSTYKRKINTGFSSKPTLTYKVGEKLYSVELESIKITSGQPAIKLEVETNKNVIAEGEELTVICTVTNTGTADFTGVEITEKTIGDMFSIDGLAAGESQVFTKNITIDESTKLEFTAAGDNGTEQEWIDEKTIEITVDKSTKPLQVEINASPSALQIPIPGMIDFDIIVNNRGEEPLTGLKIIDQDNEIVADIETLPTGQSTYQWSVDVDRTKIYTFTLLVPQEDGTNRLVNSGPIEIKVEETPLISPAPEVTPTEVPIINDKDVKGLKKVASSLGLVVAIVLAAVIVLSIIVARTKRKRR
jgi:hypothetical protein